MAYERTTIDVIEIWSNYGYGWDAECEAENWQDARRLLKEYNENAPQGLHKIKTRRVKKTA